MEAQSSLNMVEQGKVIEWLRLRHVLNMKAMQNKNESVSVMFRNVFDKELVHGSSLILRTAGEKKRAYGMHRLVRRFIRSDMERCSVASKNAFSVAVPSLHKCVEGLLEKEKRSFREVLDYSEDRHHELVPPIIALIEHSTISIPECTESVSSKLKDILLYGGYLLRFLRKIQEEVQ